MEALLDGNLAGTVEFIMTSCENTPFYLYAIAMWALFSILFVLRLRLSGWAGLPSAICCSLSELNSSLLCGPYSTKPLMRLAWNLREARRLPSGVISDSCGRLREW